MTHPLALYAVEVHLADLRAEADANRQARLARQAREPRNAGFVASLAAFLRGLTGSHDANGATSPA